MKLPDKKYEPKHNDELKEYAMGWNIVVENTKYLCFEYGDAYVKEGLLITKTILKEAKTPFLKGKYDCIIEIERLNAEEKEARDVFDEMFSDSMEELDSLTIKSDDELDKKLEELNKYNEDRQMRML